MHIEMDQNWRVLGFPYHDGHVGALYLEEEGAVLRMLIRATSGQVHELRLHGITALRIDGLREDNIIHNIRAIPCSMVGAVADVEQLLRDRLYIEKELLPPAGVVALIEPSYGAEVIAICEAIRVTVVG